MSQDNRLVQDLLLQMHEEQMKQGQTLARLEGGLVARVEKLEHAQRMNWWMTYVVTPAVVLAHAVARHFGVQV